MRSALARTLQLLAVVAFALPGCSNSPTGPGIEPEIVATEESFSYQISAIEDYTGAADYPWHNNGTAVNVDLSTVGSSGVASLVVRDAAGAEVFSAPLTQDGSFTSATGESGIWTIHVDYVTFTGTVNFRVQMDT
jgi:hypothetical protein